MIHRSMSEKQVDRLSRYGEPAHLILLSLSSGSKHGYAIIQDIFEETGIKLGPGTLYGAITKLVDQGLIEAAADTGNRRRPYRITGQGKQVLASYVATWSRVMGVGKQRLAEQ
jgi:DNA-binding PadR family transcriptional regulator